MSPNVYNVNLNDFCWLCWDAGASSFLAKRQRRSKENEDVRTTTMMYTKWKSRSHSNAQYMVHHTANNWNQTLQSIVWRPPGVIHSSGVEGRVKEANSASVLLIDRLECGPHFGNGHFVRQNLFGRLGGSLVTLHFFICEKGNTGESSHRIPVAGLEAIGGGCHYSKHW